MIYELSDYHKKLNAEARHLLSINSRLAMAWFTHTDLTSAQREEICETMRANRVAAERIRAQIAWERWFNGDPQVWRPAEPSWRN